MALSTLTLIILLLVMVAWMAAEFRGGIRIRIATGLAALVLVAVMAFFWGRFAEAFSHWEFLEPHDSPGQTAQMDNTEKSATNNLSR